METIEKVKAIISTKKTEWKPFLGTDTLPAMAKEFAIEANAFKSGCGNWLIGCIFYKGDIETTKDWIIVTNDGGYYKVDAYYMIWHRYSPTQIGAQAIWSNAALKRSLKSLVTMGNTVPDPGYQT